MAPGTRLSEKHFHKNGRNHVKLIKVQKEISGRKKSPHGLRSNFCIRAEPGPPGAGRFWAYIELESKFLGIYRAGVEVFGPI